MTCSGHVVAGVRLFPQGLGLTEMHSGIDNSRVLTPKRE
jgi:hypothetical protein